MYDRIVHHELLENPAFHNLHDDTCRLLLVTLILRADDFGNQDGDLEWLLDDVFFATRIRTVKALASALSALEAAGLVRSYVVDGQPYLNAPHLRNRRTYTRRIVPPSPWCDKNAPTGPFKAGHRQRARSVVEAVGGARKMSDKTIAPAAKSESDLEKKGGEETANPGLPSATRLPKNWTAPDDWIAWALRFWEQQRRPLTESEIRSMADEFRDYWRSRCGAYGRKINWFGTWRIWVHHRGARERVRLVESTDAAPAGHGLPKR